MARNAPQMLGAAGQPFCRDFDVCPEPPDGAGLPLLPFLWGGNAANAGLYRSLVGSAAAPLAVGGAWSVLPPDQTLRNSVFGPGTPLLRGVGE